MAGPPLGAMAMCNGLAREVQSEAFTALAHMEQALEILDRDDATLQVTPHLDLAICRLRELLGPLASIQTERGSSES